MYDDAGLLDGHFPNTRYDHLMIVMLNIHAKIFELSDETLHLFLVRISAHIAYVFELRSAEDLVNCARQPICNGNLGFVF